MPAATQQRALLQSEISKKVDVKSTEPIGQSVRDHGELVGYLVARDSDLRRGILPGITVIVYDKAKQPTHFLLADEA
ncbi:hypothetical protein ACKI1L_38230, partial [Streptomyces scabiei]|uniref:hypothetical protein n=1 Tax=Streptomyces scabiei TaxID=1930 RepID=UPI0038F7D48B